MAVTDARQGRSSRRPSVRQAGGAGRFLRPGMIITVVVGRLGTTTAMNPAVGPVSGLRNLVAEPGPVRPFWDSWRPFGTI